MAGRRPRPGDRSKRPGFSCGYIDAPSLGEVKVVTASTPRFIPHGIGPRPKSLLSGPDGKPPTWSERLQALRYVPPLLKLVYQTHRGYTVAILALRALRSFIPLAVLWIGKLIIDGVIAAMRAHAAGQPLVWGTRGGSSCSGSGSGAWGEYRRARARENRRAHRLNPVTATNRLPP